MTKGRTVPIVGAVDSYEEDPKIVLVVFVVRDKHGTVMFSSDKVTAESIQWNSDAVTGEVRPKGTPLIMRSEFALENPKVERVLPYDANPNTLHQLVTYSGSYHVPMPSALGHGRELGETGRPTKLPRFRRRG